MGGELLLLAVAIMGLLTIVGAVRPSGGLKLVGMLLAILALGPTFVGLVWHQVFAPVVGGHPWLGTLAAVMVLLIGLRIAGRLFLGGRR